MTGSEPSRIVVGVDGSDTSAQALRWAASLAVPTGATLEIIATWLVPASYGWPGYGFVPEPYNPRMDAEKAVNAIVDRVFDAHRPAALTIEVVEGHAAHVLTDRSHGATLLVVGSRGHGGFAGLLLGSVSAYCAEHAACPVVVVHGDKLAPTATS